MINGGIIVYSESSAARAVLRGIGFDVADAPSPLVDCDFNPVGAALNARDIAGKIISEINSAEESILKKYGVNNASQIQRRILVWLHQAGAMGIAPADLERRVGSANTLRTAIYSLRKMNVEIDFANGVYKLNIK